MFLKQIKLENIRCFKEIEIDFTQDIDSIRKWTLLLGENGTGKSSILRSIALLLAGSDALFEVFSEPQYWIKNGCETGRISALLQTQHKEEREIFLEFSRNDSVSSIVSQAQSSLKALDSALAHTQRNYFILGYGASRRLNNESRMRSKSSSFSHPRAQSLATLFDSDAYLNPLESWAMDLDYRHGKEGTDTVKKVLSDFLPGMSFKSIDKEKGQLLFDTPDGIVPLQQLSDGYQNVAAWIGDLLYRITDVFEDYKNPLKTRGLLIIDEIDLHLHPIWQRRLFSFLQQKLPNLQVIATTHSAVTAQQGDKNELYYLKRRGKTVSINQFETDPGRLLINQLLMTEAFGLNTDESLKLENKKKQYKELSEKPSLSNKEKKQHANLKDELLGMTQNSSINMLLKEEQIDLLNKVQDELMRSKS